MLLGTYASVRMQSSIVIEVLAVIGIATQRRTLLPMRAAFGCDLIRTRVLVSMFDRGFSRVFIMDYHHVYRHDHHGDDANADIDEDHNDQDDADVGNVNETVC